MMSKIKLPEFSLIEKNSLGGTCDGCGRSIKHVYKLKNNKTGEIGEFGSGCAKNFMHGKTITEVVEDEIRYQNALKEEDLTLNSAHRVQEFAEINPEMMRFIEDNLDNDFLNSMKTAIETYGTLTQTQYDAVYGMMLPPAELPDKVKNLTVNIFRVKIGVSHYGYQPTNNYTLFGETEDHKLVRIYFSSISEKNEELLIDREILKLGSDWNYYWLPTTKFKRFITINGSFDGYKIKRVKILN